MKRFLRIFELSTNEQRVVLIVIFVLLAVAFAEYERRVHYSFVQQTSVREQKSTPTPFETENEQ